jgi:hypothetical protein
MKQLLSGLCASALALSFAAASVAPANAAPIYVPKAEAASPAFDVETIQYRDNWDNDGWDNDGWYRRDNRRMIRKMRRGDNYAYHNGYRGYRDYRPGYKQHGDYWYPAAAFIAGALITGAIVNNSRRVDVNAHEDWCYDHYRSYREWDNTWKPIGAPRRQCNSPFD